LRLTCPLIRTLCGRHSNYERFRGGGVLPQPGILVS
jgi:hypothetical protein